MSDPETARKYLEEALPRGQWKAASFATGHDHAYIQQYIKRGTPRWLGERERETLVDVYGLDPARLRPPPKASITRESHRAGRYGGNQSGVDPKRLSEIADDPRTGQLLRIWARIEKQNDRDIALAVLGALADKAAVRTETADSDALVA